MAPGYRPRSATNDLKGIVEDALEDLFLVWDERFASEHGPLHPRVRKLLDALVRCGDLHFGGSLLEPAGRCLDPDISGSRCGWKVAAASCQQSNRD